MMEYKFNAPAFLSFGEDCRFEAGEMLKKWGVSSGNVLLVHGKNVKASGLVDELAECLEDYGFGIKTFDEVMPDAPVEVIRRGVEFAKKEDIKAIIAIGGGSGMDIAKAIGVMLDNEGDILRFAGVDTVPNRRKTVFIAIPTTCGTGSEMTDGGVVMDTEHGKKVPFWDVFAGPDIALLDPFMLEKLPKHMVAQTAMDALAHCAEAYTGTMSNPISGALAIGAIEIIAKYASMAYRDENRAEALEMLLTASSMAGIAFNRSNVHLGHAIAHAAGAVAHIHHGAACALALPFVMQTQAEKVPDKVRRIGQAMGIDCPADDAPVGEAVAKGIQEFCASMDVKSFGQYGIQEDQLDTIVQYACSDIILSIAPRRVQPDELKAYLLKRL